MFSKGKREVNNIIRSMKYFMEDFSENDILKIYINCRYIMDYQYSINDSYQLIYDKYKGIATEETCFFIMSFVLLHRHDNTFYVKTQKDMDFVLDMVDIHKEQIKFSFLNTSLCHLHHEDIGYNIMHPLYVSGFINAKKYINNLRNSMGESFTYKRVKSYHIIDIYGMVDEYKLKTKTGYNCTIYINDYCNATTNLTPSGLYLIKNAGFEV